VRAIFITPNSTPAISEINVKGGLQEIQDLVGGYIQAVSINKTDVLFVDEEWALKDPSRRHEGVFAVAKKGGFGGRGLILGKGGEKGTKLGLLEASSMITILPRVN